MKPGFFDRGGWWVIGQSILMLAVTAAGPLWPGVPGRSAVWLAGLVFLFGAVVGTSGVVVLRGNRTIYPRPNAGSQLVQSGIYRWIRHPLYTSVMALSAAWAVVWASWPAAATALTLAVFLGFKAAREERWLTETFPEYEAYRRRTKRFLPGVL